MQESWWRQAKNAQEKNIRDMAGEFTRLASTTPNYLVKAFLQTIAKACTRYANGHYGSAFNPHLKYWLDTRPVHPETDDLITAIRKLGGIDTYIETHWAGRLSHLTGNTTHVTLPNIERPNKGESLDCLSEKLCELGYLKTYDMRELEALLSRAERGEMIYSTHYDYSAANHEPQYSPENDNLPDEVYTIDPESGEVVIATPTSWDAFARHHEDSAHEACIRSGGPIH